METDSHKSVNKYTDSGQQDDSYLKWQSAMEDVEFHGNQGLPSREDESADTSTINLDEFTVKPFDAPLEETGNKDTEWDLTRVGGQLGSNEGGTYEAPNGERYYVKFYENPSQGKVEFVANAIYERLGIKSVHSKIIHLEGREAIASRIIPDAMPADIESLKNSEDVWKGFVADAFLANWDVVGLAYDNIAQSNGSFYRIDNGGSLIFRALGGDKEYSPDSIPELQSMLIPRYQSGRVFAGITDSEIRQQARELVDRLSPEDIKTIVDESGLEGEDYDRVLSGLLGRLEYLAKNYYEKPDTEGLASPEQRGRRPRRSVSEIVRDLRSEETVGQSGETVVCPRAEILCDRDHIEDQRIDIIDRADIGKLEFRFKLREPTETISRMVSDFKDKKGTSEITTPSGAVLSRGSLSYEGTEASCTLCDAFVFEKAGMKVFIADPTSRNGSTDSIFDNTCVRTALGLIKVEAPIDMDSEKTQQLLEDILENDLGIPDALREVPEKAEREYKIARYKWQHVIDGELLPEEMRRAEALQYEEVFPGYTALVEKGKYREYLSEYGEDIRAVHLLVADGGAKGIHRVLTQGLICTTERYSIGLLANGMSSIQDMDTGGADSVFTRTTNSARRKNLFGTVVVFKPEIFDRTDWYAYDCDHYGSTEASSFSERLSPDKLFAAVADSNESYTSGCNENMFRTGIGANYIESVEVDSTEARDKIIADLRRMGLEKIGDKLVEEIVLARHETKLEEVASKATMQALIDGKIPYISPPVIFDIAYATNDANAAFEAMAEAIVAHGKKEELVSDLVDYFASTMYFNELESLAAGKIPDGYSSDDAKLVNFMKESLGVDYGAIYQEALASQEGWANHDQLITY